MLNVGDKAPNFELKNQDGEIVKLSDFLGKKVVIYFYPKDNTPGCTKQSCGFGENFEKFQKNNIIVIGINKDSEKTHKNFANKYNLPFILLSDTEKSTLETYGVWQEKKLYGKINMGIVRTTFVIDESRNIEKIFEKVKAEKNPEEVMEYLNI